MDGVGPHALSSFGGIMELERVMDTANRDSTPLLRDLGNLRWGQQQLHKKFLHHSRLGTSPQPLILNNSNLVLHGGSRARRGKEFPFPGLGGVGGCHNLGTTSFGPLSPRVMWEKQG